MIECPLCSKFEGTGKVPSAKIDPQNIREYDECPVCRGSGEVEEVKTDKQIITIYKYHGGYQTEAQT